MECKDFSEGNVLTSTSIPMTIINPSANYYIGAGTRDLDFLEDTTVGRKDAILSTGQFGAILTPTITESSEAWTQINMDNEVSDHYYETAHNWITDCDLELALDLISCCRGNTGQSVPVMASSPVGPGQSCTPPSSSAAGYTGPLPTLRLAPPDKDIEEIQLTIANQLRIQQSKQKLHFNKSWPSTENPPGFLDTVASGAVGVSGGCGGASGQSHWMNQRPIGQQQQMLPGGTSTSCDHQIGSLLGDTRWRFLPPSPNSVSPSSGGGSRGTSPLPPLTRPTNPVRDGSLDVSSSPPISLVVPTSTSDPRIGTR